MSRAWLQPCRPPCSLSTLAGKMAGGQRALSVGRSAQGGPCGLQSSQPNASAGALMTEALLPCPVRPGLTVPAASQVTLREAATQQRAGASAAWGAHACQRRRQAPALAPAVHPGRPVDSPWPPSPWALQSVLPRTCSGRRRGAVEGVFCRDAAGHKHLMQPRVWGPLWPL